MTPKARSTVAGLLAVLGGCSHARSGSNEAPDATTSEDAAIVDANVDAGAGDAAPPGAGSVFTQHNDNARTGVNAAETCLTPPRLPFLTQVGSFHVTGHIYAQPLLLTAQHLLIVATSQNELAAFDTTTMSTKPVWQLGPTTFGTAGNVPKTNDALGILATPVIDPATNRLYVTSRSCPAATAVTPCPWQVHVIDAISGTHLDSVTVGASVVGGDGGTIAFDQDIHLNRPGLLLQGGTLVTGWAILQAIPGMTTEATALYRGWVIAFDVTNLHAPPVAYVTTAHGLGAGVWQSGGGLTGDGQFIYLSSGNATLGPSVTPTSPSNFPVAPVDQENSVIRLALGDGGVQVKSFFDDRPYHADGNIFQYTNFYDFDFSSSGVGIIPDSGTLVAGSKGGIVYLLDQSTLALVQAPLSPFTQKPLPTGQTLHITTAGDGPEVLGAPVVWRRSGATNDALIYWWPRGDKLTAFDYEPASGSMTVKAASTEVAGKGGGVLSMSSNAGADAILWAIEASGGEGSTATVLAYDPQTLDSMWQAPVPAFAKFSCPTIGGGRVYVPSWAASGDSEVLVFGVPECGD